MNLLALKPQATIDEGSVSASFELVVCVLRCRVLRHRFRQSRLEAYDLTHDGDGRCTDAALANNGVDGCDGSCNDPLVGAGAVLNHSDRGVGRHAVVGEDAHNLRDTANTHHEDEGAS